MRAYSTWTADQRADHAERVKRGQTIARARGARFGNLTNLREAGLRGREAQAEQADRFAAGILPVIEDIRSEGVTSMNGIADALKALRLSPQDPFRFAFLDALTLSHYASRNYEAAADAAMQLTGVAPEHAFGHFCLATAYGQLGRSQEARHALRQGMRVHPDFSKEFIAAAWPYKDAADQEHFMEGLHKAGLPE